MEFHPSMPKALPFDGRQNTAPQPLPRTAPQYPQSSLLVQPNPYVASSGPPDEETALPAPASLAGKWQGQANTDTGICQMKLEIVNPTHMPGIKGYGSMTCMALELSGGHATQRRCQDCVQYRAAHHASGALALRKAPSRRCNPLPRGQHYRPASHGQGLRDDVRQGSSLCKRSRRAIGKTAAKAVRRCSAGCTPKSYSYACDGGWPPLPPSRHPLHDP